MITIYHNPKCSKSRKTLALLEESTQKFQVIEYLQNPMSKTFLSQAFDKLGMSLVRVKEEEYKELRGKSLSKDELVKLLIKFPKLIERPILVKNDLFLIARPPEKALLLF